MGGGSSIEESVMRYPPFFLGGSCFATELPHRAFCALLLISSAAAWSMEKVRLIEHRLV